MTSTEAPHTTPPIADTIRHFADQLVWSDLPAPRVKVSWHDCDDDTILEILEAFPNVTWRAGFGPNADWVEAESGGLDLVAFASTVTPARPAQSRLTMLLPAAYATTARACADEVGA